MSFGLKSLNINNNKDPLFLRVSLLDLKNGIIFDIIPSMEKLLQSHLLYMIK